MRGVACMAVAGREHRPADRGSVRVEVDVIEPAARVRCVRRGVGPRGRWMWCAPHRWDACLPSGRTGRPQPSWQAAAASGLPRAVRSCHVGGRRDRRSARFLCVDRQVSRECRQWMRWRCGTCRSATAGCRAIASPRDGCSVAAWSPRAARASKLWFVLGGAGSRRQGSSKAAHDALGSAAEHAGLPLHEITVTIRSAYRATNVQPRPTSAGGRDETPRHVVRVESQVLS